MVRKYIEGGIVGKAYKNKVIYIAICKKTEHAHNCIVWVVPTFFGKFGSYVLEVGWDIYITSSF
jgi:hypothetical protein